MEIYHIFLILFFIMVGLNLFAEAEDKIQLRYISKPLLMPLLILYYWIGAGIFNWLIVAALACGCIGDICLMFDKEEKWFMYGLLSFLIGHVFYIIVFLLSIENIGNFPLWGLILLVPSIIVFVGWVLPKTNKKMGKMQIPTMIYAGVILTMGLTAILRLAEFEGAIFIFVYLGSLLFIISDAIIAVDRFNEKISHGKIWIMATYTIGQFFITYGLLLASFVV